MLFLAYIQMSCQIFFVTGQFYICPDTMTGYIEKVIMRPDIAIWCQLCMTIETHIPHHCILHTEQWLYHQ